MKLALWVGDSSGRWGRLAIFLGPATLYMLCFMILPYANISRNAHLTNVIVDANVTIPEVLVVGQDPELDAKRFRRSAGGICLITQPMIDALDR